MIKLELPEKPAELTPEKERELVEKFKADGSAVWKKSYITKPLLAMTNNKCAYSEQALNQESAYMEVDHFKHKNLYQDEVVRWGNLLPSCKKCNDTKSDWDVMADPIVNPLADQPRDFLYVKAFRFYMKNEKGQNTIRALALNDRDHFVNPRSEIGFRIVETLVNRIKSTLSECGLKHIYSAVLSTHILYESPVMRKLEERLQALDQWDEELEAIRRELESIALPSPD